jgi:hypothetical protein
VHCAVAAQVTVQSSVHWTLQAEPSAQVTVPDSPSVIWQLDDP